MNFLSVYEIPWLDNWINDLVKLMRLDITNKFKRGWQVDINPATKPNISDLLTGCD